MIVFVLNNLFPMIYIRRILSTQLSTVQKLFIFASLVYAPG